MENIEETSRVQHILEEIDRLIAEMTLLKSEVAILGQSSDRAKNSIREAEFFGMWADRQDLIDKSTQEWLDDLRKKQWSR